MSSLHIFRQQAIQLLDKFLRYDIIEKAINKPSLTIHTFKDNKDLYRLKKENIPNPYPTLSPKVKKYIKEDETTKSPSKSLKAGVNSSLYLNDTTIESIATSCANSSASSIKQSINGISSTKSENMQTLKELLLHELNNVQPLFASLVDTQDINSVNIFNNITNISSKNGVVTVNDKSKDLPHWVMSAMRCLANWPYENTVSLPRYNGFERDVFNLIKDYFVELEFPLIPHYFYPLLISMVQDADQQYIQRVRSKFFGNNSGDLDQQSETSRIYRTNSTTLSIASRHSDPYYYHHNHRKDCKKKKEQVFETIFLAENSASKITNHQLAAYFANVHSSNGSLDDRPLSPDNDQPQLKSPYCGILDAKKLAHIATLPRLIKKQRLEGKINRANSFKSLTNRRSLGFGNVGFILQSPSEEGEYMMDKSVSSSTAVIRNANIVYSNSIYSQLLSPRESSSNYNKSIQLLSLVLLMIPSENRRHLHLLLRLLTRICRNKQLKIFYNSLPSIEYYVSN